MSDIVERLRESTDCDPDCHGRCKECPQNRQSEAADEIQLLRQHVVEMAAEADRLAALIRSIACSTDPEHGRRMARQEMGMPDE